jgi:hypothetical protein
MEREYVRERDREDLSWHLFRTFTRTGNILTLCGRQIGADGEQRGDLPDGRTCESCYRVADSQREE